MAYRTETAPAPVAAWHARSVSAVVPARGAGAFARLRDLSSAAGNAAVAAALARHGAGDPARPLAVQRVATITGGARRLTSGREHQGVGAAFEAFHDRVKAVVPPDWYVDRSDGVGVMYLGTALREPLAGLMADVHHHGTFDLGNADDVVRLATLLAPPPPPVSGSGDAVAGPAAQQPAVQQPAVPRRLNHFDIRPPESKAAVLEELRRWSAYYDTKLPRLTPEQRKGDPFKFFENSGDMTKTVVGRVSAMNERDVKASVRIAVNPARPPLPPREAPKIVMADPAFDAVIVYSGAVTFVADSPAYVADVVAHPKSLVPPSGKARRVGTAMKGGGRALLENAVLTFSPRGIKLWPLDDLARKQYESMRFGAIQFEPLSDGHLLLKPQDVRTFAAEGVIGLPRDVLDEWLAKHP